MNVLREYDRIVQRLEASQARIARMFGQKWAWKMVKSYLTAYMNARDREFGEEAQWTQ